MLVEIENFFLPHLKFTRHLPTFFLPFEKLSVRLFAFSGYPPVPETLTFKTISRRQTIPNEILKRCLGAMPSKMGGWGYTRT